MRFYLIVAAALATAGLFAPTLATESVVGPMPRGLSCNLGVSKPWVPFGGQGYFSEAYSNGGACAGAVVTIVVRARSGLVLWTDAMPAAQVMTFTDAKTPPAMKAALADWLAQPHTFKSSADLPPWKKGAEAPMGGEFPFYPETGMDQETYAKIRAARQAMFCYVRGMESMACIAIARDGAATKLGVQSFPG